MSGEYLEFTFVIFFSLTEAPLPDPHPDPTHGPETDPKQTQNGAKRSQTDPNGAKRSRNAPKSSPLGWDSPGGFVRLGRGVEREK